MSAHNLKISCMKLIEKLTVLIIANDLSLAKFFNICQKDIDIKTVCAV
jgi:hypothetical protein